MKAIKFQKYVAGFAVVLFLAKIIAWYLTGSVMVLTDALEGIVNMVTGFLGLYSLNFAAKPRDTNHPFGHGKIEYLSSAVEGILIIISAFVVIYEAIDQLIHPHILQKLDIGLIIVVVCGLVNYGLGKYAAITGKKQNSIVLESAGKHLITDGYSSLAIILGLALLLLMQWIPATKDHFLWLDNAVALIFAMVIIVTGYHVLRKSISGIMDEVDMSLLKEVVDVLHEKRKQQWVDLHNLRVIQYGNMLHVDAHMTLPFYYSLAQGVAEVNGLESLIKSKFDNQAELFIHIDPCTPDQCKLCSLADCKERSSRFENIMDWNIMNLWTDEKHFVS